MPWKEVTAMSLRLEFVRSARVDGANVRELCQTYEISPRTAYKWLRRYAEGGAAALQDLSRRPTHSPGRSSDDTEAEVLAVRQEHPTWGGRKIRAYLTRQGRVDLPCPSTITEILRRHGCLDASKAAEHRPFQHFEMPAPNLLWQMDFKGYFALAEGGYCHPLSVLDDHSRFLVGLRACPNERTPTVQAALTDVFRRYGLPDRMLMDNGSPWGDDAQSRHTLLTAWLIRLGIHISHCRPRHPQTQGKDERLHRTLQEELLSRRTLDTLAQCEAAFDSWSTLYNYERPHEVLQLQPPATRYQPSPRPFPELLPPILYEPDDIVRKVDDSGKISFRNQVFRISRAFRHQPVALRPGEVDGRFDVYFCSQKVANIHLPNDNTEI